MDILEHQGRLWAFRGVVRVGGKHWQYRRHADQILGQLDIPAPRAMSTSRPTGTWGHFLVEGGHLYLRAVLTFMPPSLPGLSDRWVLRRAPDEDFAWDWSRGGFWPKEDGYEYTLTEPLEVELPKSLGLYEHSGYFRHEPKERLTVAR